MDDSPAVPLIFANRVIRQFADHLLGGDLIIKPKDFMVIRLIYRKMGGKWVDFVLGDPQQVMLLEKVVTNWGKMPGREREQSDD